MSNRRWQENEIRIQTLTDGNSVGSQSLKQSLLRKRIHSSYKKRSGVSIPKIAGYTTAFLVFVGVIAVGYQSPQQVDAQVSQTANVASLGSSTQLASAAAPSVDDMVATDVAATLTEQTSLPIASAVANTATSLSAQNDLAQTDDTAISKPQIIQPTEGSRSVQYYEAKAGDTVEAVAAKYGVSPTTISWANNLNSDAIAAGQKLIVLPVNGIVHTLGAGETVQSLAAKYGSSAARIVSFNDLELSTPQVGQSLVIPDGVLPENERPGYVPPRSYSSYGSSNSSIISSSLAGASAGNRYVYGYCTWYAYERRSQLGMPVGSFWGNANTWAVYARAAGYNVDNNPTPGSVLQTSAGGGGYGHVAIVESVKDNGDIVVSEMNYVGFNIVSSRTISAGQAAGYQYIH